MTVSEGLLMAVAIADLVAAGYLFKASAAENSGQPFTMAVITLFSGLVVIVSVIKMLGG